MMYIERAMMGLISHPPFPMHLREPNTIQPILPCTMESSSAGRLLCATFKSSFNRIAACATRLSDVSASHPCLPALAQQLACMFEQLVPENRAFRTLDASQRAQSADPATVTAFSGMVTALVQQLARLEPWVLREASTMQAHKSLWVSLVAASNTFENLWPVVVNMDHTVLHTAMHRLMAWALTHVRGSYHHEMYGPGTASRSGKELHMILDISYKCLTQVSKIPSLSAMKHALCALPPDYLALLCCIACETVNTLADPAFLEAKRLFMMSIAAWISDLDVYPGSAFVPSPTPPLALVVLFPVMQAILACQSKIVAADMKLCAMFSAPAVIELCKLIIILAGPQYKVARLHCGDGICTVLIELIQHGIDIKNARQQKGLPPLPPHSSSAGQILVPSGTRTDRLLIGTLCKRLGNDPSTAFITFRLLCPLLSEWRLVEMDTPESTSTASMDLQADRTACVYQVAHMCTLHAKRWLCSLKAERQQQRRQTTAVKGQALALQQQQQQDSQQRVGGRIHHLHKEQDPSGSFEQKAMRHVRSLMALVCMYKMRVQQASCMPRQQSESARQSIIGLTLMPDIHRSFAALS